MRHHALCAIVAIALAACGGDGAPGTEEHTERMTEATRDALWIDRTWNNAYKGHGVEVDEAWSLRIKQYRCYQRDNSLTGDKLDTARCDAKQDGWEWKPDPRRVPLMQIDPETVGVVSGKLEDDAQGLALHFHCRGKRCWGDAELDGILCRDQKHCDAMAADLESLIALGAAAGASAEGDVFPKPEPVQLSDEDVAALENLGKMWDEANQYEQERFEETVAQLTPDAEAGDPVAQFELAKTYALGLAGLRRDYFAAFNHFKAAAEQGHAGAQYALGNAYEHGLGVHYDLEAALKWYRAAVSLEEAANAAERLERLKRESPSDGDEDDLVTHAILTYEGPGRENAVRLFHLFAAVNNATAQYFLGHHYQWGFDEHSPPPDDDYALKWYRLAAEHGNVWAQLEAASMVADAGVDDAAARYAEAMKWYAAAAKQGSPLAKQQLSDPTFLQSRLGIVADAPPTPLPPSNAPNAPTEVQACDRILGEWEWHTGPFQHVLTFTRDNRVGASAARGIRAQSHGVWSCDGPRASFVIQWQNGDVEHLTMAADSSSVSGSNNRGAAVGGMRLR